MGCPLMSQWMVLPISSSTSMICQPAAVCSAWIFARLWSLDLAISACIFRARFGLGPKRANISFSRSESNVSWIFFADVE